MSMTPVKQIVVPKYRRDLIVSAIKRGERVDGRRFDEFRRINVELNTVNKAEGSAMVKLGNTIVITGVKAEIGAPFPDTPNEGALQVHAEFVPLASPVFEPGPPDENAIEVARVIDRGIRESGFLKLGELVITPEKRIWVIYVDLYLVDHDGNVIDAGVISSVLALRTARLPKIETLGDKIILNHEVRETPIPLGDNIVSVSLGILEDYVIVDPTLDEESILDSKLTFIISKNGNIVGLQKSGMKGINLKTFEQAVETALRKAGELHQFIDRVISS